MKKTKLIGSVIASVVALTAINTVNAGVPTVSSVSVNGTAWNFIYDPFEIPEGATQLNALPWFDINQVIITFSEDVNFSASDIGLFGVNTAVYSPSTISGSGTTTATLDLASPLTADKLLLQVKDSASSVSTTEALDGDWVTSSSTFDSGNGLAGGDFLFRFNVLPGDVNGNGMVTAVDAIAEASDRDANAGVPFVGPEISVFDLNGDGFRTEADSLLVINEILTNLPAGEPVVLVPDVGTYFLLSLALVPLTMRKRMRDY